MRTRVQVPRTHVKPDKVVCVCNPGAYVVGWRLRRTTSRSPCFDCSDWNRFSVDVMLFTELFEAHSKANILK